MNVIVVCVVLFLFYICLCCREYTHVEEKAVICCLTRGYETVDRYDKLIKRNASLSQLPWVMKYDHVIFHEGNISLDHQRYIASRTTLSLRFVNIRDTFTRSSNAVVDEYLCKPSSWSDGYKRMCRFWFVDFWDYVKEYQYLVRFDEDVVVSKNCKDPIDYCKRNNLHYATPYLMTEHRAVIDGLDRFTGRTFKEIDRVPATHTQMIHLPYYTNNPKVKAFINRIDQSGCILHNRWGDAPLMGILVREFTNTEEYDFNWKGFVGYHGSHNNNYN